MVGWHHSLDGCRKSVTAISFADPTIHHLSLKTHISLKISKSEKLAHSVGRAVEKCEHTQWHDRIIKCGIFTLNEDVEAFFA